MSIPYPVWTEDWLNFSLWDWKKGDRIALFMKLLSFYTLNSLEYLLYHKPDWFWIDLIADESENLFSVKTA